DHEPQLTQHEAEFEIDLPGHSTWTVVVDFWPVLGHLIVRPDHDGGESDPLDIEAWVSRRPRVRSSVSRLDRLRRQAIRDLATLRIRDPENPERAVLAAGIPWFMTLFGRDSVLTSWQLLPLDLETPLTTARVLA